MINKHHSLFFVGNTGLGRYDLLNGCPRVSQQSDWICLPGTPTESTPAENTLCCLFVHLPVYCVGQPAHCHHHLPQSTLSAPMYSILTYLALLDASFISVSTPKMMIDLLYQRKTISWGGCQTQLFLEHFIGGSEITVLTVMAYDHYMAICKPLHYMTIMQPSCDRSSASSWWWWPGLEGSCMA